MCVVFFVGTAS